MVSEKDDFRLSGPVHLSFVNWTDPHHKRTVAASLVKGVYVLELDRQLKRQGPKALASPWWKFFHFNLLRRLVDDVDSSIFGAIFEFKPLKSQRNDSLHQSPRYVIAFRGTIKKAKSIFRDLLLGLNIISNDLHETSRFETAFKAILSVVFDLGESNVWIAGHSLGAAIALIAGKAMAKSSLFVQSFLFNSPYFSASAAIEKIKNERVKHWLRIASKMIKARLAFAVKKNQQATRSIDPFTALADWYPCLFVNPSDQLGAGYIGYFEHRKKMDEIGIRAIGRCASQNSLGGLVMSYFGGESEPFHLIPSAHLTINLTPVQDFKEAHGIHQWWRPDLQVQSKLHKYK